MEKWLVDVKCDGCKGLFYRSAPNVIVPDADWPRNGDVVAGYEIPNIPGASILGPLRATAVLISFIIMTMNLHFAHQILIICFLKRRLDSSAEWLLSANGERRWRDPILAQGIEAYSRFE